MAVAKGVVLFSVVMFTSFSKGTGVAVNMTCPSRLVAETVNDVTCRIDTAEILTANCISTPTNVVFQIKGQPTTLCTSLYTSSCSASPDSIAQGSCGCTEQTGNVKIYLFKFKGTAEEFKGTKLECRVCDAVPEITIPPTNCDSLTYADNCPSCDNGKCVRTSDDLRTPSCLVYICETKTTVKGLIGFSQVSLGTAFIVAIISFVCKGTGSKRHCPWTALVITFVLLVVPAGICIAGSIIYQCQTGVSVAVVVLIALALGVLIVAFMAAVFVFVWKDPPSKGTSDCKALVKGLVLAVAAAILLIAVGISLASLSVTAIVLIDVALLGLAAAFIIAVIFAVWKDTPSGNDDDKGGQDPQRAKPEENKCTARVVPLVLVGVALMILIAGSINLEALIETTLALVLIVVALVVFVIILIIEIILYVCCVTPLKHTCQWITRVVGVTFSVMTAMILTAVGFQLAEFPGEDPCTSPCLVVIIFTVVDVVGTLIPAICIIVIKRK